MNPAFLTLSLLLALFEPTGDSSFSTSSAEHGIIFSKSISALDANHLRDVTNQELSKRINSPGGAQTQFDPDQDLLIYALDQDEEVAGKSLPALDPKLISNKSDESYQVVREVLDDQRSIYWIVGRRLRGLYYGFGHLLRSGSSIIADTSLAAEPAYALRGHQLGYRNTANSWDAWTAKQFDSYIRDLVLLGSNAIEDIPFQNEEQSVHMTMPHKQMHPKISQICKNYDIDYWVWTPANGDLSDTAIVTEGLANFQDLFRALPKLDAVFFPGGDPGDNHPRDVFPYLEKVAKSLHQHHPHAGLWISLQGFDEEKVDFFFEKLNAELPDWITGLVYGPSSPSVDLERNMLPAKYGHRLYGDITHTIRCQYPTPQWDQAYALTLGREPPNPQPALYREIFLRDMPHTDGFLSYSDGVHDDVNKVVWNMLGWDPAMDVDEILLAYCTFFFGEAVAPRAAEGIIGLENNWVGPLSDHSGIAKTLQHWQDLDKDYPQLTDNWRWQLCLLRAYYDASVQHRLIAETAIETEVNAVMAQSKVLGSQEAMRHSLQLLNSYKDHDVALFYRNKIFNYAEQLFESIGLQTSVEKYQASSAERGCIIDFLSYPLNNRWWLFDQFEAIRKMGNETDKIAQLEKLASWENPGPGNYYDNISRVGQDAHVTSSTDDAIDYAWWDQGMSRRRLSTQLFQFAPSLTYHVDPDLLYTIKVSGQGEALLRVNGELIEPQLYPKELETIKVFELPPNIYTDGKLNISFDRPNESHLNWRQYSKVTDVWLVQR